MSLRCCKWRHTLPVLLVNCDMELCQVAYSDLAIGPWLWEGSIVPILRQFGNLKSTYSGNFGSAELAIYTSTVLEYKQVPEFETCTLALVYTPAPYSIG